MEPIFSISESLQFGWHKTREHSGLLFQTLLTFFTIQVAYSIVVNTIGHSLQGVLAAIALIVLDIFLATGFTIIVLKIARGEDAYYKDLFPPLTVVVTYTFASLLASIIIAVGFVLLIAPGIYFLLRFCMVRFAAVDGVSIMESLKRSTRMTQGVRWHLLGFLLVLIGLNILGAILFLVGLLISVPVTMLAFAHIYQKLLPHVEGK